MNVIIKRLKLKEKKRIFSFLSSCRHRHVPMYIKTHRKCRQRERKKGEGKMCEEFEFQMDFSVFCRASVAD